MGRFDAEEFLQQRELSASYVDAVTGWGELLRDLVDETDPRLVMEIGGGRSPLWYGAVEDRPETTLVVNDISQEELDLLPADVRKARFDVSDPDSIPAEFENEIDLVFSNTVMEHVRSTDRAMEATHRLLRPGGVGFHIFPTLWASPFVLNKAIPFAITKPLVKALTRARYERFPAVYRQTKSTERQLARWRAIGFDQLAVARFYGHGYYDRIPVLRELENAFTRRAEKRDWHWYSSYVYLLVVK